MLPARGCRRPHHARSFASFRALRHDDAKASVLGVAQLEDGVTWRDAPQLLVRRVRSDALEEDADLGLPPLHVGPQQLRLPLIVQSSPGMPVRSAGGDGTRLEDRLPRPRTAPHGRDPLNWPRSRHFWKVRGSCRVRTGFRSPNWEALGRRPEQRYSVRLRLPCASPCCGHPRTGRAGSRPGRNLPSVRVSRGCTRSNSTNVRRSRLEASCAKQRRSSFVVPGR